MFKFKVGQFFPIPANPALGTPSAIGVILEVYSNCYVVHILGDDPKWSGPVTHQGEIVIDFISNKVQEFNYR